MTVPSPQPSSKTPPGKSAAHLVTPANYSQALVAKGIKIVPGDVVSLKAAVQGADVVFATTAFSDAFVRALPSDLEKCPPVRR